jgi:hypothetical protein
LSDDGYDPALDCYRSWECAVDALRSRYRRRRLMRFALAIGGAVAAVAVLWVLWCAVCALTAGARLPPE